MKLPSPTEDLNLFRISRVERAKPSHIWGSFLHSQQTLPTNSWYQNLVSNNARHKPSSETTKVYTIPYILDVAPPSKMVGFKLHMPVMKGDVRNMQMVYDATDGLSLGMYGEKGEYTVDDDSPLSLLGVSLNWGGKMKSHIVRGMPYGTMIYSDGTMPTIESGKRLANGMVVDGKVALDEEWTCGELSNVGEEMGINHRTIEIQREVQFHFKESDFTWIVFFSRPVKVKCFHVTQSVLDGPPPPPPPGVSVPPGVVITTQFRLNVVSYDTAGGKPLTVRMALVNECTTGKSIIHPHCDEYREQRRQVGDDDVFAKMWKKKEEDYANLLRQSSSLYPVSPKVDFEYGTESDAISDDEVVVTFDWDVHRINDVNDNGSGEENLLVYTLPHQQGMLQGKSTSVTDNCISSFHGRTCAALSDKWLLTENIAPFKNPSFTARRPPEPKMIPNLASSLRKDIVQYRLETNLKKGVFDTYFSGKLLSRLGRVVLIAKELKELQNLAIAGLDGGKETDIEIPSYYDDVSKEDYLDTLRALLNVELPSDEEISNALDDVKTGVQVWLSNDAEAPYIYDESWGGLVNCGCVYYGLGDGTGECGNYFPNCPALYDPNRDFGNAWYNDHHFHYGYHIYAASIVANFDHQWGKEHFDRVMLYVRDIANPFPASIDPFFTQFRHKDWFLGISWASGLMSSEDSGHGRNQESSSEAIAAYEGLTLYSGVMMDIFKNEQDESKYYLSKHMRNVGQLLTTTEVNAANRFYHIWSNPPAHESTYPETIYDHPVVGMLFETMASLQTWFAPYDFVSYGIQLLPLTPVCEIRDDPTWATILHPKYERSCYDDRGYCDGYGWSIMLHGLLATSGHRVEAMENVMKVPNEVYDTAGGNGHSLSNTLWYIGTRKKIA